MRRIPGAALALCLLAAHAAADSVAATLEAFAFFGTWAPHCDQPASPTNSLRAAFATPDGQVTFTESLGADSQPNVYVVRAATRKGRDTVVLRIELNDQIVQDLTMVRKDGLLRTMTNRQVSNGKLVVSGGIVLGNSQKTPWLSRCGDGR
jgi:hypothetical protein